MDRRRLLAGIGAGAGLGLLGLGGPATKAIAALAEAGDWAGVEAFLSAYLAEASLPGGIIAIGRGQEAPHYFSVGTATRQGGRAIDQDSLWRIYSMTKPITGMGAMLLIEDGAMALDQNIADFLPEFADPKVLTDPENGLDARPARGPITVRHLLTHTAGLGYTIVTQGPLLAEYQRLGLEPYAWTHNAPEELAGRPQSLAEFSERLATLPLIADPGTVWSYSMSLDLMGRVIEVVSGRNFDAFLAERIFAPLGMNDTFFQVPAGKVDRLTDCHIAQPEGAPPVADPAAHSVFAEPPLYPYGGAGLVSSARDYDRFLAMVLGEGAIPDARIMAEETARLATSDLLPDGVTMPGGLAGQGFGAAGRVALTGAPGGEGVGTYGWGGAASTVASADPANGLRVGGYIQLLRDASMSFSMGTGRAVYESFNAAENMAA